MVLSVTCATVLSSRLYASAPLIFLLSPSLPCPLFQPDCDLHHLCSALGVHLLLKAVARVVSIVSSFLRSLPLDSPTKKSRSHFYCPLDALSSLALDFSTSIALHHSFLCPSHSACLPIVLDKEAVSFYLRPH